MKHSIAIAIAIAALASVGLFVLSDESQTDDAPPQATQPLEAVAQPSDAQDDTNTQRTTLTHPAPIPSIPHIAEIQLLPETRLPGETEVRHLNRTRLQREFESWVERHGLNSEQRSHTLFAITDAIRNMNAAFETAMEYHPPESGNVLSKEERRKMIDWRPHSDALLAELRTFLSADEVEDFEKFLHFGELWAAPIVAVK